MIGKTLGHDEIDGLLGKGGMGEVYRARDPRLDRAVAIEILPANIKATGERTPLGSPGLHTSMAVSPDERGIAVSRSVSVTRWEDRVEGALRQRP